MAALALGAAAATPAKAIDSARFRACAAEAVRWSLLDKDISEPILVDGTSKFRHIRVDGYARHWDERIWSFISAPPDPASAAGAILVGYVDPTNRFNASKIEEKKEGMREILDRCLKEG